MKKIAIITLTGYFNYGNRLQNYALETILKKFNCNVETIKVKNDIIYISKFDKYKHLKLREIPKKCKNYLYYCFAKRYKKKYKTLRENNFINFSNKYLTETNFWVTKKTIPDNFADNYDYFVVGSDQVWNPNFSTDSSLYFLTFAPREKRIAYAASFGINSIPENYKNNYKIWLESLHKISVREEKAARIIKDLIGKDVPVHLDPTFLLTTQQWLKIASDKINLPNKKYLLTYFLGSISKDQKRQIKLFAKRNNLIIINITNIKEKKFYISGPSEFLKLIANCSFFCTNSFHGTVFSILFEKPFVVYNKSDKFSMYSRIITLLKTFKLETREVQNINFNDKSVFDIDYTETRKILEIERELAIDYLKKALKIEENS